MQHSEIPIDTLLLMTGEGHGNPRSNLAVKLFNSNPTNTKKIVVCGAIPAIDSANPIEQYLIANGIPSESITLEDQSVDTLGGIIKSASILQENDAKAIGLVTDRFHMYRAHTYCDWVYGSHFDVYPIATDILGEKYLRIKERISLFAAHLLTWRLPKGDMGNLQGWEKFLDDVHPLYASDPPLYALLLNKGYEVFKKILVKAHKQSIRQL